MRLCIITEYFHPETTGATPAVLSRLARYLKDHYPDVQIDVITSRNAYRGPHTKFPSFEAWDGIDIYRVHSPRSNRPSTLFRFATGLYFTVLASIRLARLGEYDAILVGTNPPAAPIAVRLWAWLRKTPYVYLIHDLYPDLLVRLGLLSESHPITKICRYVQRRWLHGSCTVIVLGRCMQDYLMGAYGLPRQQIEVIPNWSDPGQIVPLPKHTNFRLNHGLDGFIVLCAGNLGQHHDFDNIIDSAKILSGHDSITFVIVGDGAKRGHIAQRIAQEGITNMRMFPFVPAEELADLLASADVSLITLERGLEGLGVPSKLYGIMASARPAIAIMDNVSEVVRVLEEAQCGIQVPHHAPSRLAEVIVQLANDPDMADRMGANARQSIVDKYTIQRVAEQYYQVLRDAMCCRMQAEAFDDSYQSPD